MKNLKAGPLQLGYEGGFLRRIRYGETEVLRMIYFASRDQNWNTLEARMQGEEIAIAEKGFTIKYDCQHLLDGHVVIEWKVAVSGNADGALRFEIDGAVKRNFRRNRAGFCVLHPPEVAGTECVIQREGDARSVHSFPENIAPQDPFTNIQSMTWRAGEAAYRLTFEGDLFETEDQRNWADASFKTFCTPLHLPFPVEMKTGQNVFQRIIFEPLAPLPPVFSSVPYVELQDAGGQLILPRMGICASTEGTPPSEAVAAKLRELGLHHYRIDVVPSDPDWVAAFSSAYEFAFAAALPLEVALHLGPDYVEEMEAFSVLCQHNKVRLKKVLLLKKDGLVTDEGILKEVPSLKGAFPNTFFGAGTNYNFTEVNRNRFAGKDFDFISFSIDPQEHASDDLTIMENADGLHHLVRSAKSIYGDTMPVHISPLTLRKRFNPYAASAADVILPEAMKADPRQKTPFAAAWTAACVCSLAEGGASHITFFQTAGNQGIMSPDGDPYPVYEVLKLLSGFQGRRSAAVRSSNPLLVKGLNLGVKKLVVNLSAGEQLVRWKNTEFFLGPFEIRLHELNHA